MRKKLAIIGIVIAALIFTNAVKNQAIRSVIVMKARAGLSAPVTINSFSMSFLRQKVAIKGLIIHNPKEFPKGLVIDIPSIFVDYDIFSLLRKKLHLALLAIDLKEVHIVKDKEGKTNLDALKTAAQQKKPAEANEQKERPAPMRLQIDTLTLNIGKVVYEDYSAGEKPVVQVYDINLKNKVYKNITSFEQLAVLILTEPMKQAAIKGGAIYGIAAVSGVGLVPVAAGAVLTGKDSASAEFNADFQKVYEVSLGALQGLGEVSTQDAKAGTLTGKIKGNSVAVKITEKSPGVATVVVSAKKYLIPNAKIARGLLYEITQKLRQ